LLARIRSDKIGYCKSAVQTERHASSRHEIMMGSR